jgi:hypothetical protein
MPEQIVEVPAGYSYPATAAWFAAGGIVTAIFSGSLATLAKNATLAEVLATGMIVPSFTWVVELSASAFAMPSAQRQIYWGDLGRVCLIGSAALLPAAALNLCYAQPQLWWSAANVLASVALMGVDLTRRAVRHGIGLGWPLGWCLTIALNMGLFVWSSRHWW